MTTSNIYSDAFYHDREIAVREQIDQLLDSTQKNIVQLHSPCLQRMMKIQEEMTLEDLLTAEPNVRQEILSAILFNDALWRIEAAYLMLALGMLSLSCEQSRRDYRVVSPKQIDIRKTKV